MNRIQLDRLMGRRFWVRLDESGRPQVVFDADRIDPTHESDLWVKCVPEAEFNCQVEALKYADTALDAFSGSLSAAEKADLMGVPYNEAPRLIRSRLKAIARGSK